MVVQLLNVHDGAHALDIWIMRLCQHLLGQGCLTASVDVKHSIVTVLRTLCAATAVSLCGPRAHWAPQPEEVCCDNQGPIFQEVGGHIQAEFATSLFPLRFATVCCDLVSQREGTIRDERSCVAQGRGWLLVLKLIVVGVACFGLWFNLLRAKLMDIGLYKFWEIGSD